MSQSLSLDVILSTIDKASAPLRSIDKASGKTAQQLKETRQSLKQLQGQQKDLTSFRELQRASKQVKTEFAAASEKTNRLKRQMEAIEQPTKTMMREFERATNKTRKLRQQHIDHAQSLKRTREALKETGITTANLSDKQQEFTRKIEQTDRALANHQKQLEATRRQQQRLNKARDAYRSTKNMAGNLAGAGMTATAGGTATLLAVAKTASVGMDFDESMSKVQALTRLDKDSKELQALREQARNLGATTMFTASDAASGQSFLAMAGFTPDKIKKAMPGILDMAAAAGVDIATAANIGSNILSGFNKDASEMSKVGDVLTSAFTQGNVDLMMLGETMKYVAPVAQGLGVDIELTAAMAAKLGDAGIQSSMAGTGLKAILSRLAAGPKMAKEALAGLGVEAAKANGDMRPMVDILVDLDNATKHLGKTQRQEALKNIAGAEAVSSLMVLVDRAGKGELQKLHQGILKDKDIGISKKTANIMADNASGDLKTLVSSIQDVAIEITSLNNDSLRDLIKHLTQITRSVGSWIKETPELAASIGKVITVAGALLLGFGALALTISALLIPFALLRFGLTAVGLKGSGLTKLVKKLGSSLLWLGKKILPMVGRAAMILGRALLMNPIGLAVTAIAGGAYLIYKNWDGISSWFKAKWQATKAVFNAFKTWLASWWQGAGGTFTGALSSIGATLVNWSPFGVLYKAFADALRQLGIDLPKKFSQLGAEIIKGLISGLTGKMAALKKSITGIGDNVSGWFKKKLDINSPSKVFIKHGSSVVKGLEHGLAKNQNTLQPLKKLTKQLKQAGSGLTLAAGAGLAGTSLSTQAAGTQSPNIAFDTRPPLTSQKQNSAASNTVTIEKLEIHTAPGMDEQALARFIVQEINKREQQQLTNQRASFDDFD